MLELKYASVYRFKSLFKTYNRTMLELKLILCAFESFELLTYNRTMLELKCKRNCARSFPGYPYNRTMLELKW